jgi:hypothetical protein
MLMRDRAQQVMELHPHQLRYDLRKMKAHGRLERDGRRYAYRLTEKGTGAALLLVLFHQCVCGAPANSLFQRRLTQTAAPSVRNRSCLP